jgi:antibiotic biosynthesis monooxygenase (ABM) superfamily enzyme
MVSQELPTRMSPPRYKLAIVTWLAVYPTITAMLAAFEPLGLLQTPMPVRTLLLTIVLVPLMVFVLVPILSRALAKWLWR